MTVKTTPDKFTSTTDPNTGPNLLWKLAQQQTKKVLDTIVTFQATAKRSTVVDHERDEKHAAAKVALTNTLPDCIERLKDLAELLKRQG